MKRTIALAFGAAAGVAAMQSSAMAQGAVACPVKLGGILPLTGSMGPVGKRISDSAQLAVEHINQGGGVKGCQVQFILRDDQGQPTVGVDAAKYLIDVERVPAITGTVTDDLGGRTETPFVKPLDGRPMVIRVLKEPQSKIGFGEAWHTDLSYLPAPPAHTR